MQDPAPRLASAPAEDGGTNLARLDMMQFALPQPPDDDTPCRLREHARNAAANRRIPAQHNAAPSPPPTGHRACKRNEWGESTERHSTMRCVSIQETATQRRADMQHHVMTRHSATCHTPAEDYIFLAGQAEHLESEGHGTDAACIAQPQAQRMGTSPLGTQTMQHDDAGPRRRNDHGKRPAHQRRSNSVVHHERQDVARKLTIQLGKNQYTLFYLRGLRRPLRRPS